jgi:hypothetical protein
MGKLIHSTPDKCAVDKRKQGQMRKDRRLKIEVIDFIEQGHDHLSKRKWRTET